MEGRKERPPRPRYLISGFTRPVYHVGDAPNSWEVERYA